MVVFIGDKPSARTHPTIAFKGAACEPRLSEWISYLVPQRTIYSLYNTTSEGAVIWTLWHYEDNHPIVALGNNASKWLRKIPHFKMPHPSGRNRKLNDKEFVKERLNLCKTYIDIALSSKDSV